MSDPWSTIWPNDPETEPRKLIFFDYLLIYFGSYSYSYSTSFKDRTSSTIYLGAMLGLVEWWGGFTRLAVAESPLERVAPIHPAFSLRFLWLLIYGQKTMLLFSWPVRVHKQAFHLPQKSWGNGRASPYKENKGSGRGRGWWWWGGVCAVCGNWKARISGR